jgi:hypothetical protein
MVTIAFDQIIFSTVIHRDRDIAISLTGSFVLRCLVVYLVIYAWTKEADPESTSCEDEVRLCLFGNDLAVSSHPPLQGVVDAHRGAVSIRRRLMSVIHLQQAQRHCLILSVVDDTALAFAFRVRSNTDGWRLQVGTTWRGGLFPSFPIKALDWGLIVKVNVLHCCMRRGCSSIRLSERRAKKNDSTLAASNSTCPSRILLQHPFTFHAI